MQNLSKLLTTPALWQLVIPDVMANIPVTQNYKNTADN